MRIARDNRKRTGTLCALLAAALLLVLASPAGAAVGPKWRLDSLSNTTVAQGGKLTYFLQATNVGDTPTNGTEITWQVALPSGITAESAVGVQVGGANLLPSCFNASDGVSPVLGASSIVCKNSVTAPRGVRPSFLALTLVANVSPAATGTLTAQVDISGGGAAAVTTYDPVRIAAEPPEFGFDAFDGAIVADEAGTPFTQAGGHPYGASVSIDFNTLTSPVPLEGQAWPAQLPRNVLVDLPPGLIGNPAANTSGAIETKPLCPSASQVGTVAVRLRGGNLISNLRIVPIFNMVPPSGAPARFAFNILGTVVTLDAELRPEDYGISVRASQIPEALGVAGTTASFWGEPAADAHDFERGCPGSPLVEEEGLTCALDMAPLPFFRTPTSCTPSLTTTAHMDSWKSPGAFKEATWTTHESPAFPAPPSDFGPVVGVDGCEKVKVQGSLQAKPTSRDASTVSGLNVHVEVPNPGLVNPTGIASSDVKKVEVALPEGMTVNPSQAEGLGACSEAAYESSELSFHPTDAGCPEDSKIGSVEVKTPILEETIPGDVFIAQPYDNPFGSLLALYVVLEEPQRGILVKLAGKVTTDPFTGQIIASFDDLPQLPFSSFDFKFREGARAPLVTPQACGTYETVAQFTGHSDPNGEPLLSKSSFQIDRGIGGGACPSGGIPPFKPGLQAGTLNNAAGSYSPFNLRLFRTDSEQEFTNFSIKLPPGLSGKLAGVPACPDQAIEAAKQRSGAEEIAAPACPAASAVGRTLAGAGVGSVLTYAPGRLYLAGPYHGSPLSIVSVTAAKVGPFDLGTVVVRLALRIDPETAEVFVDATGSDPIPHIIDGITVHLRDIRAYVDRPDFTLNPTSCARTSTASTVLGSGLDFSSAVDDEPVTVSTRFQAASCASLAFKPKLALNLIGGTKRGGHPKLRAILKMRGRQANIARAQVTLPKSAFLDQSHIRTVCTRVQYAANQCPSGSIYGYARAYTPLLDEALEGPVYLRSSSHQLPDLVAGLKSGRIEIDLAGRIDSLDGRIRSTFEAVPDAPVSKFVLIMRGAKKGLIENSADLCVGTHRAIVAFDGQNGKIADSRPKVGASCGKASQQKQAASGRSAR